MVPNQHGIFVRSARDIKKDLRLASSVDITHLRVCNGFFLAAISSKTLLRLDLSSNEKPQELNLPVSHSDTLAHLHLSPNGKHALASFKSGENFYLNTIQNSYICLKRIKGVITAVGWNPEVQKESETGAILLGTLNGAIHETNITDSGSVLYLKELSQGVEKDSPVCDIGLRLISDEDSKNSRWAIFVCQPNRLYSLCGTVDLTTKQSGFVGASTLQAGWIVSAATETPQHIFHQIFNQKDACLSILESPIPSTSKWSYLAIHPMVTEPNRFVWVTGNSYAVGRIVISADNPRDVLIEEKQVELPLVEGRMESAIGVSLTEFHILLAFPSRLVATSVYTHAVVFDDRWAPDLGSTVGMVTDSKSECHWVYTPSCTLKYSPNDETRYVWRVLLERGEFGRACQVAKNRMKIDPAAYELVLKKQADRYMEEKKYVAAAEILAFSSEPFETVVLRFLSTDDDRKMGLKTLLDKKLEQMNRPDDRIRRDALVMWLLEIQLAELAELRRECGGNEDKSRKLSKQIESFLNKEKKNIHDCVMVNKDAVYKLMVSHADFDTQLYLANSIKDWETVIDIHLLRGRYKEALAVLKAQGSSNLFYKYAPLLVPHSSVRRELFACLTDNTRIKPQRLMPILSQCRNEPSLAVDALSYLEFATKKSMDMSLHNLLISMYAIHRPARLQQYFEECGKDKTNVPYDLEFAVRTTQQHELNRCTIYLYCVLEMFSEAVRMALKIDLRLAKECAQWMNSPDEDFLIEDELKYPVDLRRRVWLDIASHVIRQTADAASAIDLLKESGDVIKIQDILPFFPDFTKIKHFKEPLCECLREHSSKIQALQIAMKDATQIAKEVREKTDKLKKRVTVIRASEICSGCGRSLCSRPFYVHACRHFFHRDCLEEKILQFLDKESRLKLEELVELERRYLAQLDAEDKLGNKGKDVQEKEQQLDKVSSKIGEILGHDCPLCGLIAIDQIDQPLLTDFEYEEDCKSWMI